MMSDPILWKDSWKDSWIIFSPEMHVVFTMQSISQIGFMNVELLPKYLLI